MVKSNKRIFLTVIYVLCIVLIGAMIIIVFPTKDGLDKSQVDNVSDDVYRQMVEVYFYEVTFMEMTMDEDLKAAVDWVKDQEHFEEAEKHAEEHGISPMTFFPNTLLFDYGTDSSNFNETEKDFIEKLLHFDKAVHSVDGEKFEELNEPLKNELNIKDSYNPFD